MPLFQDSSTSSSPTVKSEFTQESSLVVACAFLVNAGGVAAAYTFGVFQEEYTNHVFTTSSEASVSIIGSILASAMPVTGPLVGFLADKYGYSRIVCIGGILQSLGWILASFCTSLWQLYFTQGAMVGFGVSLINIPSAAICSQWFQRQRGIATGIVVSGVGFGGFIFGPLTSALLQASDWQRTCRYLSIITGLTVILASRGLKENRKPKDSTNISLSNVEMTSPQVQVCSPETSSEAPLTPLKADQKDEAKQPIKRLNTTVTDNQAHSPFTGGFNPVLAAIMLGNLIFSFGYFVPFIFLPSYCVDMGLNASFGAFTISILNISSAVGRLVLGRLGDCYGHFETMVACLSIAGVSLFFWPLCETKFPIVLFAICFGFFCGGYISLVPAACARIFGIKYLASYVGVIWFAASAGNLSAGPIAGSLLDASGNWTNTILYAAFSMTSGSLVFFCAIKLIRSLQSESK